MEPQTGEQAAPSAEVKRITWQSSRLEIEQQWHTALHGEASDVVPSKLSISLPPVRHTA